MNECVWFVATLDLSLLTLVIATFPLLARSLALPSLVGAADCVRSHSSKTSLEGEVHVDNFLSS